jgi:hypothetical protein
MNIRPVFSYHYWHVHMGGFPTLFVLLVEIMGRTTQQKPCQSAASGMEILWQTILSDIQLRNL